MRGFFALHIKYFSSLILKNEAFLVFLSKKCFLIDFFLPPKTNKYMRNYILGKVIDGLVH